MKSIYHMQINYRNQFFWIFWKTGLEYPKSGEFFLHLYLDQWECFLKISAKLVKKPSPDLYRANKKISQIVPAVPEEIGFWQTSYCFVVLIVSRNFCKLSLRKETKNYQISNLLSTKNSDITSSTSYFISKF